MRAFHFVFRATGSQTPFAGRDPSVVFWHQLCSHLDRYIALCLMPNHGHLIVQQEDRTKTENAIRLSLLAFKRKVPSLWSPIPEPTLIPDMKHLRRQVRYVHLNPCRSHLTGDPLHWEFSTHWDYLRYSVGSISVPSVQSLSFSSHSEFHKFVSADFTTHVAGTLLPQNTPLPSDFPLVSLDRVAQLSLVLTRSPANSFVRKNGPRRLFYSLAMAAGYKNLSQIARYLGVTPQSVAELVSKGRVIQYPEDQARRLLCDHRLQVRNL